MLADVFRQLPTAYLVCSVRLASESFCALVESDDELWRNRRRAFLSYVSPHHYPPELVRDGWISVEDETKEENKDDEGDEAEEVGEEGGEQKKIKVSVPPKVTMSVQGKDRLICEAFVKHSTQKWAIETVMRSWRKQFLSLSVPMEQFWDRKWNEREDVDVYGKKSDDPIVNNRQIDLEEMQRLVGAARRSLIVRIQEDDADRLYEQKEQERLQEEAKKAVVGTETETAAAATASVSSLK